MQCTVHYYDQGVSVHLEMDNFDVLLEKVRALVQGTDDSIKMLVDVYLIKELKEANCIEIDFAEEVSMAISSGKTISIKKILIPFTDPIAGTSVLYYCGKSYKYDYPPFINSKGATIVNEIHLLCEKNRVGKVYD